MYEHMTYEGLLDSMLAAALAQDAGLDTREGSVLWYGPVSYTHLTLPTILRV